MIRRALLMLVGVALLAGCGGECQTVCKDSVVVNATIDAPAASLQGSSLVFCQDSRCTSPTQLANNTVLSSGGLCATVAIGDQVSSTTISVSLDLSGRSCTIPSLNDGDSYKITITNTDGQTISDQSGVADYHDLSTCGTECQSVILQLMPT